MIVQLMERVQVLEDAMLEMIHIDTNTRMNLHESYESIMAIVYETMKTPPTSEKTIQ